LINKVFTLINLIGLVSGFMVFLLITLWVVHQRSYDAFTPKGDRIYRINFTYDKNGQTLEHWRTPPALARALSEEFPEVESSARFYTEAKMLISGGDNQRFYLMPGYADSSLLRMFDLPFLQGDPDEALRGVQSIVLTAATSRKLFGDQDPVGQTVNLDNRFPFTVTGVIQDPPANSYLQYDCLIPFLSLEGIMGYGVNDTWDDWGYNTFALLHPMADPDALKRKLDTLVASRLTQVARNLYTQPLREIHLRGTNHNGSSRAITIFSSIALLVLLIACINYMNLSTAMAMRRSKEIGIRKVGGADRRQLILQFLGESVMLTFISLVIALSAVSLLLPLFSQLTGTPLSFPFTWSFPAFRILVTLITGIIAGSYPAFVLSGIKPLSLLQRPGRSGRAIFRKILVVAQFSLSVFLIVCTIVFSRQLHQLSSYQLGFNTSQILFVPMNDQLKNRFQGFREELLREPGIEGVSAISNKLGTKPFWGTLASEWQGRTGDDQFTVNIIYADSYFQETFGLEMVSGRYFRSGSASDSASMVINEAAARRMGMTEAVGKTMFGDSNYILGVLKDFHFRSLHAGIEPLVVLMNPEYTNEIGIRVSTADLKGVLRSIERVCSRYAPDFPFQYSFLDDDIARMYEKERQMQQLFIAFSLLAIVITCLGLFGLAIHSAEQKIREIGIRKVMGASPLKIGLLFAGEYSRLILLANLLAWPAAWYAMHRWLEGFAWQTPLQAWIFLAAGAITFGVAILTMTSQTLRAARINPVNSLRYY